MTVCYSILTLFLKTKYCSTRHGCVAMTPRVQKMCDTFFAENLETWNIQEKIKVPNVWTVWIHDRSPDRTVTSVILSSSSLMILHSSFKSFGISAEQACTELTSSAPMKDVCCNTVCVFSTPFQYIPRGVRVCPNEVATTQDHGRFRCTGSNVCEWNRSAKCGSGS